MFKNFQRRTLISLAITASIVITIFRVKTRLYAPTLLYFQLSIISLIVSFAAYKYVKRKLENKESFKKEINILVACLVFAMFLLFLIGYRIPNFDRHPTWKEFPNQSNEKIEIIKIANFKKKYGHIYQIVDHPVYFGKRYPEDSAYMHNLKNFKSLGFVPRSNYFNISDIFTMSRSDYFQPEYEISWSPIYIYQRGWEYLEMNVGDQKLHFKVNQSSYSTELYFFNQYNKPDFKNDTLFFKYGSYDYKAYVKTIN